MPQLSPTSWSAISIISTLTLINLMTKLFFNQSLEISTIPVFKKKILISLY